ncbi:MAG: hypothetical protein Tsb0032_39840 [Kiloniellaceae bacterium]
MAARASSTLLSWPLWGLAGTLLAALLLGGHQHTALADLPVLFSYGYWILRLTTAYLLFAGGLLLLEMAPPLARLGWGWLTVAAAALTLPFFTLSVTMLDMLLGLPEMGFGPAGLETDAGGAVAGAGMASLFVLESLYHLDNHLALCALIVLPRVLLGLRGEDAEDRPADAPVMQADAAAPVMLRPAAAAPDEAGPAFFERFDPPLPGPVLAVQAQEHYVRVVTAEGAGTTLYRFGDALRELEGLSGLQVHRSFWVADDGVARIKAGKRGLKIVLRNGEQVPVSARHAETVQRRYGERLEPVA